MRQCSFVGTFFAFTGLIAAVPATARIPTAITTGTASARDTSSNALIRPPSDPALRAFDKRFEIPGTDTVLYIAQGAKVQRTPLQILLSKVQLDLVSLIDQHGPEGVPRTKGVQDPRYSFSSATASGKGCYFFVNAYDNAKLNYRIVNETVAGLKLFLIGGAHVRQAVFRVEIFWRTRAFGGLSVGGGPEAIEALSSMTSIQNGTALRTALSSNQINLRCTYGDPDSLSPSAIETVLRDALTEARVNIFKEGASGLLPGPNGEWKSEGEGEAQISIAGTATAHLTWGLMQDAIQAMKTTMNDGSIGRAASCEMMMGDDNVGSVSVTKAGPSIGQQ
ncbi:MAG: hypothetical protein Q9213_003657 [Squamulea squamosa]